MIAFDFEYYKPSSLREAVKLYEDTSVCGKETIYYTGGTEFITFARKGNVHADVVIDMKGVPEYHVLKMDGDELVIGAAVTLNEITESEKFPLLGNVAKKIADHTSRNKITIGGNVNSKLKYREGLLPLLLADAKVEIVGGNERKLIPLEKVYKTKLHLKSGQCLVQFRIPAENLYLPHAFIKRTKMSKIGYPVVSAAAILKEDKVRFSFSGVCDYPFRSQNIEQILNDEKRTIDERIQLAITRLPTPIVDDLHGSAAYREFLMSQIVEELIKTLGVKK